MERGIQIAATLAMLIIALSHILRPRVWVAFFTLLYRQGEAGVFIVAFLHLPLAALIVGFHQRWTGIPLVLTLLGWAWMLKATLYFLFPRIGLWGLERVSVDRAHEFVIAGWVLLALAVLLGFSLMHP